MPTAPTCSRWRNHPEVRAVSLTQHEITDERARGVLGGHARGPDAREIWVYDRHGVPSGVVTYFDIDREAGSAWWGYYLDNDGLKERGELLPAWIEIQRQAKRATPSTSCGLTTLEGEVLEANEAVRRFNRRNGFEEIERYTRDIDGTPSHPCCGFEPRKELNDR